MTISEKIFRILDEKKITQKEFSERTGIPQSTISDWRKKNTNPASDKILIICEVLNLSPYELLSAVQEEGTRSNKMKMRVIADGSEEGIILELYDNLNQNSKNRLLGYMEALKNMEKLEEKER